MLANKKEILLPGNEKVIDSTTSKYRERNTIKLTANDLQILDDFKTRRLSFESYLKEEKTRKFFTCPSCGFPTLTERGGYDICVICDWEDDGQDDAHADEILGGPNAISLTESRLQIGRELRSMTDSLHGDIIKEPAHFFRILNGHEERMKTVEDKIKPDAEGNDPAWENWRQTRALIKRELIKSR